jgi:structural maintenance of chromosome 3 (chondroitin sulfate proteoglycan 6)
MAVSVSSLVMQLKLDGVYGPLYSLFEVDDKYKVAVEVTAGNRSVASNFKRYFQP